MIRILSIGLLALVALGLITNAEITVNPSNSQTGDTTKAAKTLAFKTTFDPWPVDGLERNVRLDVVEGGKTLKTFPVDKQGAVSVDLRSLQVPLRPVRTNAEGCGVHVNAYSPPDLMYSWVDFRLVDAEGAMKGIAFGKPSVGPLTSQGGSTFAVLVASAPGSVEGEFRCGGVEAPAKLSLKKGVNYLNLEGVKLPFLPANLAVATTQTLAYNDPFAVDLVTC